MQDINLEVLRRLETLSAGGEEAVRVFLEISRQALEKSDSEHLNNWVTVAVPAMREAALHSMICGLLRSLFATAHVLTVQGENHQTVN